MTMVSLTPEYRVPKREVAAEVTLLGQPRKILKLFLNECAEAHTGAERPSDLLNGPGTFFPAIEPPKRVVLVRRDAVIMVSVAEEDEFGSDATDAEEPAGERTGGPAIQVFLEDGTEIRGSMHYVMPKGKNRLLDFLNSGDRFITLREENVARLINKHRIVRVSIL